MSDSPYEDDTELSAAAAAAASVDELIEDSQSEGTDPESLSDVEEQCESCHAFRFQLEKQDRAMRDLAMKLESAESLAGLLRGAVGGYESRIANINKAHTEVVAKLTAANEQNMQALSERCQKAEAAAQTSAQQVQELESEVGELRTKLDSLADADAALDVAKDDLACAHAIQEEMRAKLEVLADADASLVNAKDDLARSLGIQEEMRKMLVEAAEEKKVMQLEIDQLRHQQDELGLIISKLKAEEAVWRPLLPELEKKVSDLHTENEQHKKCLVHSAARLISDKLHDSHVQRLREMEKSLLAFQERCSHAEK